MHYGGRWRRSTKPRACDGCRRISIIAYSRCSMSRGFSMSMPRSSRSTAIRKAQWSATIRANRGGRRIAITSHCYHTYMLSDLRLVQRVEVHPGDQHNPTHAAAGLWSLLAQLGRERWPRLLRGDAEWGNEGVMTRAEQEGLPYLFRLRATANVKRALERAMAERDWGDAGQGWQGKETTLRLMGWSRQRRVVLLRRQFNRPLALLDRTDPGQPLLGFAEVLGGKREVWEYAALVTSLDSEILTLGQLYRDRADCENAFDELKNHWGWGGFTTQDLKRCRLLAASVALIYN